MESRVKEDIVRTSGKDSTLAILRVLQRYSGEGHQLLQKDIIAKMKQDYGIAVDRKTVGRTIKMLQEFRFRSRQQEFDIVCDGRKGTYLRGSNTEVKIQLRSAIVAGGTVTWLPEKKRYRFKPALTGWQMIETRGLVVIDTDEFGLVAVLPVAMCQISSVVFAESIKVGAVVKKGDRMGCFRFGGSDVVMVFQKGIKLNLTVPQNSNGEYEHINACSQYGVLSNGKSQR